MTDPDSNPLGSDWEPDKESNLKDKTGKHKIFRNKKTGESVRWDEPNGNQKGHWHRLNPDKTTNKKMPYLDPKGNPAERNSPDTHIEPNPVLVPITPPITVIDTEVSNGTNT